MYSKILLLRFPKEVVNVPVAANLAKKFDLDFNIHRATIYPRKEGYMILELSGLRKNFQDAVSYIKSLGIKIETVKESIRRNEAKCCQCGACTAVCPSGSLSIVRPSMEISFNSDKCTACEWCVKACPMKAMEVRVDNVNVLE